MLESLQETGVNLISYCTHCTLFVLYTLFVLSCPTKLNGYGTVSTFVSCSFLSEPKWHGIRKVLLTQIKHLQEENPCLKICLESLKTLKQRQFVIQKLEIHRRTISVCTVEISDDNVNNVGNLLHAYKQ